MLHRGAIHMIVRPAGMFFVAQLVLLAAGCALAIPGRAAAEDFYRVVGVEGEDVLNVRAGPSTHFPVVGTIPRDGRGIAAIGRCIERWCPVRYGPVTGWSSARFLAPDTEPGGAGGVADTEPGSAEGAPAAGLAARRVLDDGTLEIRFADGSGRRRLPDGRLQIVRPDGTLAPLAFVNVPSADPPPLPAEYAGWGTRVGDDLLGILRNILTPAEMEAYLQTEEGKNFYQLLNWRLRSISFLTVPAS